MTRGIIVWVLLMGLVSLEVCQWRMGVPLVIVWVLLMGLGGLLWAMLDFFGDDPRQATMAERNLTIAKGDTRILAVHREG